MTLHPHSQYSPLLQKGNHHVEDETWPPFRRVGYYATTNAAPSAGGEHSADARLAVSCLVAQLGGFPAAPLQNENTTATDPTSYCCESDQLFIAVGGAGGQVSLWTTAALDKNRHGTTFEPDVAQIRANLLDEESRYVWKGADSLLVSQSQSVHRTITTTIGCNG